MEVSRGDLVSNGTHMGIVIEPCLADTPGEVLVLWGNGLSSVERPEKLVTQPFEGSIAVHNFQGLLVSQIVASPLEKTCKLCLHFRRQMYLQVGPKHCNAGLLVTSPRSQTCPSWKAPVR